MTEGEERALLEAIALGSESSAGERLGALAALRSIGGAPAYNPADEIAALDNEKLDGFLDGELLVDIVRSCFCALRGEDVGPLGVDLDHWPVTLEVVAAEVERIRAETREELRAESEATAQARARWIIEREVGSSQSDSADEEAADHVETLPEPSEPPSVAQDDAPRVIPPPPPGIDLSRGWPKRRSRSKWPREY